MTILQNEPPVRLFPLTGPELLFAAACAASVSHTSAQRALTAVLAAESPEHAVECLEMARAFFDRQYGRGAMHALLDVSAAGALTACGCFYQIAMREAGKW